MAGGEAGPCAEGKGPPATARAMLGRMAGFPSRGRRELAAERRAEGKGTSPPAGEEAFREEKRASPNSFVRRGSSLVAGGEMTQGWKRRIGRDLSSTGGGRGGERLLKAGDKKHGRVYQKTW